jgi:hypothetical protein
MARKKRDKHAPSVKKGATKTSVGVSSALAPDPQKLLASAASKKPASGKPLSEWVIFFFKHWWSLCVLVGTTLFSNIVTQLQGDPSRLWIFLQQHLPLTIGAILVTAVAPFIALRDKKVDEQKSQQGGILSYPAHGKSLALDNIENQLRDVLSTMVIPIIVPVVTTTLFLSLLLMVLFRPIWCPTLSLWRGRVW